MADKQNKLVVVVGGSRVGKSAITIQFTQAQFIDEYDGGDTTANEDTYDKRCVVDGEVALLNVFDTEGQLQLEYSAQQQPWIRTGDGFLLVYSVIDRSSFEDINTLHRDILRVKDCSYLPMVLVGNKIDLKNDRDVTTKEGEDLAAQLKIGYVETSAKERVHIDEAFHKLIQIMREFAKRQQEEVKKNRKKGNCCIVL